MFLLPLVHTRVSDIICIPCVWILVYSSFSLKSLSLLCSDLAKSTISYVFATVMQLVTQIMSKYDKAVQPNDLRLSGHPFPHISSD